MIGGSVVRDNMSRKEKTLNNGSSTKELGKELVRLRKLVAKQRQQQEKDRETIVRLQNERDEYLKALYAWSRSQVSPERLREWQN